MNKLYVVQSRSYEYNDETYEMSSGGNVVHAYTTLDAAKTAQEKLTIDSLRDGGLKYLAEQYDVFTDEVLDMLASYDLSPKSLYLGYYEAEDISDAIKAGRISDEYVKLLARGIKLGRELYFIEEVNVD